MRRFLGYHFHGVGMSGKLSIDLAIGLAVHKGLEMFLKGKPADIAADYAYHEAWTNSKDFGLHTQKESSHLSASLVWAWILTIWPNINTHKLVIVEEEHNLRVDKGITLMVRPDLATEDEQGRIVSHDFKTVNKISDWTVAEYVDNLQMSIACASISDKLDKPVDRFYIHALEKGGYSPFTLRGGASTPESRRYSDFCYANFYPDGSYGLEGFWYNKSPVWDKTDPETWVRNLLRSEGKLKQVALIGPYSPNPEKVKQFMSGMSTEERRWQTIQAEMLKIEKDFPWDTEEYQWALDKMVPRSYICYKYGTLCEFHTPCMREKDWQSLAGLYPRKPNHSQELE